MPGERLVCVWEAGFAKDENPKGKTQMPQSVLKDILLSCANIPCVCVHLSNKRLDEFFPNSTVRYEDVKGFVQHKMLVKGTPMYELEEQIELLCWEKVKSKYESPLWHVTEQDRYRLWQIFNRLASENTYPVLICKEQIDWLLEKMYSNMGSTPKDLYETSDANFKKMMDILEKNIFSRLSPDNLEKCIDFIHSWLVLEICQVGWLHKRTRKQSNWTNWVNRWFILTPGRLCYYSNPSLKEQKGELLITAHTKVETLPDYKGFIRKLPSRFLIANDPYLEMEVCAPDDVEKKNWISALHEVIEAASLGVTPVQALLQARHKKQEQRRPSLDETEKRLTRLQTTARKVREEKDENKTKVPKPMVKKTPQPLLEVPEDEDTVCHSVEDEEIFDNNMYANQRNKIKTVFTKIDSDGNGFIDKAEFSQFIDDLGVKVSDGEKELIFKQIDIDKNGRLCFSEFEDYFLKFIMDETPTVPECKLRSAFLKADRDGTGTVDFREFTEFAWERKRSMRVSKLINYFGKMDQGKGEISYDQFRTFLTNRQSMMTVLEEDEDAEEDSPRKLREDTLEKYLKGLYDQSDAEELGKYIRDRWDKFASFKRYGASGELVMAGAHGMVADVVPGEYSLIDLACFNDLPPITPKHAVIKGVKWVSKGKSGKSGKAIFPPSFDGRVPIEIATNEHLSYYGASLADSNQVKVSLLYRHGIQDFTYENRYLEDYVRNEEALGGSGIEKHEFSHLDCPMEDDSGYFIMGKYEGDELHLTAFKVPTRHTLYVPGNVIHSNDHLKGTWRTMLSDEAEIDHVHLKRQKTAGNDEELEKFSFQFVDKL